MSEAAGSAREFLRHAVATLAYRGAKALRDAPPGFAGLRAGEKARSPVEIVAHLGDLLDWALAMAEGKPSWHDSAPLAWDAEVARFFAALGRFEAFLESDAALAVPPEKLFQGPIADALTHVGQIAMLRRLGGFPVCGENYYVADIRVGRVGRDQPPARREFE